MLLYRLWDICIQINKLPMAEISVKGNMKVKTLQADFKEAYGATLRIYNGVKFADENATLASIRAEGAKGGELKVNGNMLVGNFEKMMLETFGIKVQVASGDNSKLSDNSVRLTQAK
jgi:hypothetical protein